MIDRFKSERDVQKAMEELSEYWSRLLGVYQLECGNEKLERMVNIWNQYQCMVTFNMSRSASYFESGIGRGMGFRIPAKIYWVLYTRSHAGLGSAC